MEYCRQRKTNQLATVAQVTNAMQVNMEFSAMLADEHVLTPYRYQQQFGPEE